MAGGPAVRPDDVRRQFVAGRDAAGMVGRVDVSVDVASVRAGEGADLRLGVVRGVHGVVVLGADDAGVAGGGVQFHDLVGAARARPDGGDQFAVRGEGGRELGPGPGRVDDLAGLGVQDAEGGGAPAVHDGDQAAVERREPSHAELPQRPAELLLARAQRLPVEVEVPPAAAVARVQEAAVVGPVGLGDGLAGPMRPRYGRRAGCRRGRCRRGPVRCRPTACADGPRRARPPAARPGRASDPSRTGAGHR